MPQENVPPAVSQRVSAAMLAALSRAAGAGRELPRALPRVSHVRTQLWGAALPTTSPGVPCIFDGDSRAGMCAPAPDCALPRRTRQFVEALRMYVDSTADVAFAAEVWPVVTKQLAYFGAHVNASTGLLHAREYTSFDNALAYVTLQGATVNAFLFQAYADASYIARLLGDAPAAAEYTAAAAALATAYDAGLWNASAGSYSGGIMNGSLVGPTVHAALVALQRGVVPAGRVASVLAWFLAHYRNAGTFNVCTK